ncbi:hypothetical protein [Mycobacterium sp.]|uniref:hypothetical protein n=1 Tax=Mycobacterium sp. TaxID=1785 RepID=UPI0031CDF7E2
MTDPAVPVLLPATVDQVTDIGGGLVAVTLGFADMTRGVYLLPRTQATLEAVRLSAVAITTLTAWDVDQVGIPNPITGRYGRSRP